jgi:hypothetical protein
MLQYFLDKQTNEAPHQGDKTEKPVSPKTEDNRNISGTSLLTSYMDSGQTSRPPPEKNTAKFRETIRAEIQTSIAEL